MSTQTAKQSAKQISEKHVNQPDPIANLGLQQILFFEFYYNFIFTIIQVLCMSFKNSFLPYPNDLHLNYEWIVMFALFLVNYTRV
jgi:hypothetical protein